MIIDERMEVYLESLDTGNGAFLDGLEAYARKKRVPVIRPACRAFSKYSLP